jgi:hypothetical protein
MKYLFKSVVILLVLITSLLIFPKHSSAQQSNVSFQVFYDQLSPYGQWIQDPRYGYVWIPDVGADFVPYSTDGHWVLTDYGWTWVSNYDWGWAPFHYGRWDFDNSYGWLWVPDTEWGPSWVNWRRADGYYGWEPMEPGISISLSFGSSYNSNDDHWVFVRDRDFERSNINHYYVNQTDRNRIVRSSTVINTTFVDNSRHTTYATGPARADIQRVTGRTINPVAIRENSRPGQQMNNGQLQMYRPQVNKNSGKENKPSRITSQKDVKQLSGRNATTQPRNVSPQNNSNIKAQPAQHPGTATPANNNVRQQQPNTPRPQNNTKAQPAQQPRTATPSNNNQRQQQPKAARPQNNNGQPAQQQRTAPTNNNQKQQQQRQQPNSRPQNNIQAQPVQQQRTAPQNNNQKQQQQRQQQQPNSRPQNNTQAKPVQQQRTAPPANNNQGQQQQNDRKEQDKR